MYQLHHLIGQSNVSGDTTQKYNECDDFLKLIITCYILVAEFQHLKIESLSDIPKINDVNNPQDLWMALSHEQKSVFQLIYEGIVDEFVSFRFNQRPAPSSDKVKVLIVIFSICLLMHFFLLNPL